MYAPFSLTNILTSQFVEEGTMSAPVVRSQNNLKVVHQKVIKVKEQIEMKSMIAKIKTPAIILGVLAIGALLISATVVNNSDSAAPSHDQLIDDLGEWGMTSQTKVELVVPTYERTIEGLGEYGLFAQAGFGRETTVSVVPSHDQLMDDLGEWGMTSQTKVELMVPTYEQTIEALGEYGLFAQLGSGRETTGSVVPSLDQLIDDLGEWGMTSQAKVDLVAPTHERTIEAMGEYGLFAQLGSGRETGSSVVLSHDQLLDDLGDWGMISQAKVDLVAPTHEQTIEALGEYELFAQPAF